MLEQVATLKKDLKSSTTVTTTKFIPPRGARYEKLEWVEGKFLFFPSRNFIKFLNFIEISLYFIFFLNFFENLTRVQEMMPTGQLQILI